MKVKRKHSNPINQSTLAEYIKMEYPDFGDAQVKEVHLEHFLSLRQGDFGDVLNCSITSMTAAILYYSGNSQNAKEVYSYVRRIARFFLYTPKLIGTLSFTIGPIYAICLNHFGLKRKNGLGVIKGLGFNGKKVCRLIDAHRPVILSLFRDGRGFYNNHTVTIIGYRIYRVGDKELLFFELNDNWSGEMRFLDYSKLWPISAINY